MKTTNFILDIIQIIGGLILIITAIYSFINFFISFSKRDIMLSNDFCTNISILEKQLELLKQRTESSNSQMELKIEYIKEIIKELKEEVDQIQAYLDKSDEYTFKKRRRVFDKDNSLD